MHPSSPGPRGQFPTGNVGTPHLQCDKVRNPCPGINYRQDVYTRRRISPGNCCPPPGARSCLGVPDAVSPEALGSNTDVLTTSHTHLAFRETARDALTLGWARPTPPRQRPDASHILRSPRPRPACSRQAPDPPAPTSSSSRLPHSLRKMLAPVRLPSPPMTHRLVMPRCTRL